MKRILTGLCAASLLVLGACNQAPAPTAPNTQAAPVTQQGPVPGTTPGTMPGPVPGQGGGAAAPMIQAAVQQCIQASGNSPQGQQVCGCMGQMMSNLPPEQLNAMNTNPQQAQQFAQQVLQQCAAGMVGGGGMGPGGMGPGGMGPGGQPGYGPQQGPGMYGGAVKDGNSAK